MPTNVTIEFSTEEKTNPLLRDCSRCGRTKYDKKFYYRDAGQNAIAFTDNDKMICRGCALTTGAWALAYEARSLITRAKWDLHQKRAAAAEEPHPAAAEEPHAAAAEEPQTSPAEGEDV